MNSSGFLGFFDWQFDEIGATMEALRAIKLPKVADMIGQAIQIVGGSDTFELREQYDQLKEEIMHDERRSAQMNKLDDKAVNQSAAIESTTHDYIRTNIAAFQPFDP